MKIKNLKLQIKQWYKGSLPGHLSWQVLLSMSIKNLKVSRSRTIVTVSAIAIGVGAIVFLLSFAYGLQNIVTSKIVSPNSFRLADVQSDSTALSLTPDSVIEMKKVSGVEDVTPVVSLAGSLAIGESKTDVVIISVEKKYFDYAHVVPVKGQIFSDEADKRVGYGEDNLAKLAEKINEGSEQVLGESTKLEIKVGEDIDGMRRSYRVSDGVYVPLRREPMVGSEIIGYVQGSVLTTLTGTEVWGSSYQSVDTVGNNLTDDSGTNFGRWLNTEAEIYQEAAPTVYLPMIDESGTPVKKMGYLTEASVQVLSREEAKMQNEIEAILQKYDGEVLGEATPSALQTGGQATGAAIVSTSASESAALSTIVAHEQEVAAEVPQVAIVEVTKQGGKEIVVSTGLLKTWNLEADKVLGQEVSMQYIVSGGVIPGMMGRVLSQPVNYKIVGVVSDDKQSLAYVPLAEVESMGVKKYTFAKILSQTESGLAGVRSSMESMGYSTRSVVDTLLQVERLFRVMRFLLGAFGVIALIVALFGMFNTMTVSLLERTREIGVMKTLGTTDSDVVRIFMVESGIVGMLGGVVGIIGGVGLGYVVSLILYGIRGGVGQSLFSVPMSLVLIMFVISLVVGVVTGLYPAGRAKKISALNALRYE
jgi:ABC-type antimicrobial peptide transport system permease subunit